MIGLHQPHSHLMIHLLVYQKGGEASVQRLQRGLHQSGDNAHSDLRHGQSDQKKLSLSL